MKLSNCSYHWHLTEEAYANKSKSIHFKHREQFNQETRLQAAQRYNRLPADTSVTENFLTVFKTWACRVPSWE